MAEVVREGKGPVGFFVETGADGIDRVGEEDVVLDGI